MTSIMSKEKSLIIEQFKNKLTPENVRNFGVREWKEFFSGEMSNFFVTRTYFFKPEYLYRARLNLDSNGNPVDFFDNISELWAPPYKKIKKQGRCNMPGQSRLYCSTSPATTLFELSPDTGLENTVIQYKCVDELKNLAIIGANEIMSINEKFHEIFGNHFKGRKEEIILIDDLLSLIFRGKNTEAFPIYNLTNAITQIFLNKQTGASPFGNPLPPTNIGLIYPSVETSMPLGANLVLDPLAAKNCLKPNIAYKYKILHKHSTDFFDILQTHKTRRIYPNGQMIWERCYDTKIEYITHLPIAKNNVKQ